MSLDMNKVMKITNPEIASRILQTYLSELPHFLEKISTIEEYVDKVLKLGNMYVVEEQEKVKGFIIFYNNDNQSQKAYISLIVVSKDFRRQNIGSALIKICEDASKKSGMNKIRLEVDEDNTNAQIFYQNLGFVFVPTEEINKIYMEKDI